MMAVSRNRAVDIVVSLVAELAVAALIAVCTPFLIRYFALPSSIYHHYPLNIGFQTCEHDLHSVCSFPSASLSYEPGELFSSGVSYYLNVRLKFADVATTKQLGLFQNVLSVIDGTGNTLKQYTKTAYIKEAGILTKACWVFFFPFYFAGFFHDYSSLEILMASDYIENYEHQSLKIVYTLQDKFANVEEAALVVTARFGLIRHFLYYWPTISFVIIFAAMFIGCCSLIAAKWAILNWSAWKAEARCEEEEKNEPDEIRFDGKRKEVQQKEDGFAPDEYVPDNVNEEPKNEILYTLSGENSIRRRNV
ncbi:unnamed protein product [Caenorhabditis bovis]|uniref:Seipin n=1 Tax=Caenorhabditis bovis TaxID=2654633 RepID=A0A8S1E984_9PELO|nr:unnamed protein product [Caenorhabditis bovis]